MSFKILSSEYISRHHYFTARKDSYQTEAGKIVDPYFFVELPPCAVAMALTKKKELILVKQYRHPIGESILELPGGFIDTGELPMQAIERELMEETGYSFSSLHYLGLTAANPGVLNNFTHMFLALDGEKIAAQKLDANEEIEILLKPLEEAKEMLLHHEMKQSMHALCMFYGLEFMKKQELL